MSDKSPAKLVKALGWKSLNEYSQDVEESPRVINHRFHHDRAAFLQQVNETAIKRLERLTEYYL